MTLRHSPEPDRNHGKDAAASYLLQNEARWSAWLQRRLPLTSTEAEDVFASLLAWESGRVAGARGDAFSAAYYRQRLLWLALDYLKRRCARGEVSLARPNEGAAGGSYDWLPADRRS